MPSLSIVLIPRAVTRNRTHRPSLGTQKRWFCKFGSKRRFVLLFACETLLPDIGFLPVTWHLLATVLFLPKNHSLKSN
jgi:hypothetical protein